MSFARRGEGSGGADSLGDDPLRHGSATRFGKVSATSMRIIFKDLDFSYL